MKTMTGLRVAALLGLAAATPANAGEIAGNCAATRQPVLVCESASCLRISRQALCQALRDSDTRRREVAVTARDARSMEEIGRRQLTALIDELR